MASEEAELRRQRFLQSKENAGGSYVDLLKEVRAQPYVVYFDDSGNIKCIAKKNEIIDVLPEWTHNHEFTEEQLSILKGKSLDLFFVKKDPNIDNLFSIEVKPVESQFVVAEEDFLNIVPHTYNEKPDYEVMCSLTSTALVVTLHKDVIKLYKNKDPDRITAKGKRALKFFFTSKNDPHFMFDSISVVLKDLVQKKSLTIPTKGDFSQCSIYTIKLFDKYVRT